MSVGGARDWTGKFGRAFTTVVVVGEWVVAQSSEVAVAELDVDLNRGRLAYAHTHLRERKVAKSGVLKCHRVRSGGQAGDRILAAAAAQSAIRRVGVYVNGLDGSANDPGAACSGDAAADGTGFLGRHSHAEEK